MNAYNKCQINVNALNHFNSIQRPWEKSSLGFESVSGGKVVNVCLIWGKKLLAQ